MTSRSELDLLRNAEGIINFDAEITDRAFEFGVSEQSCAIIRILVSH